MTVIYERGTAMEPTDNDTHSEFCCLDNWETCPHKIKSQLEQAERHDEEPNVNFPASWVDL